MRDVFLFLAAFILICNQANAQWSIGGKAGINLSNVNYPKSFENPSFLTGINVGLIANYQINERFDIQGEVLYSSRGYKEIDLVVGASEITSNRSDFICRFNYIDIPIVLKYFVYSGLNIHAGPQIGIALSNTVKIDNENIQEIEPGKLQPLDFGLVGGVGYEFTNGLFIDGRYLLGLNGSFKDINEFQNRSIQLALGYKFRL